MSNLLHMIQSRIPQIGEEEEEEEEEGSHHHLLATVDRDVASNG